MEEIEKRQTNTFEKSERVLKEPEVHSLIAWSFLHSQGDPSLQVGLLLYTLKKHPEWKLPNEKNFLQKTISRVRGEKGVAAIVEQTLSALPDHVSIEKKQKSGIFDDSPGRKQIVTSESLKIVRAFYDVEKYLRSTEKEIPASLLGNVDFSFMNLERALEEHALMPSLIKSIVWRDVKFFDRRQEYLKSLEDLISQSHDVTERQKLESQRKLKRIFSPPSSLYAFAFEAEKNGTSAQIPGPEVFREFYDDVRTFLKQHPDFASRNPDFLTLKEKINGTIDPHFSFADQQ